MAAALMVAATADAQTLCAFSGAFDASLHYDVSSGSLLFGGEATVELRLDAWKASAEAGFADGIWDEQTFTVSWAAEAVDIESTLRFEPDKNRFQDWKTRVAWRFGAVELKVEHKLTRTRNWLTLEVDWASDAVEMDTRVRFRAANCAPLTLYDAEAKAEFSLCGAGTSIEVEIDDEGFDVLILKIDELIADWLPWLTLDVEAERTLTGSTIEIEPSIDVGKSTCLTFEAESAADDGRIVALRLVEVALECDVPQAEIEATAYLDPDDWIDDRYAATLTLKTEGGLTKKRVIEAETTLFWNGLPGPNHAIARIVSFVSLDLTERISAWLELDIDVETAEPDSIAAGVRLTW